ncbi:MAG: rod shape-determining protein RodA [Treponema sp.]|nr:rod shape-determining protein RodA [Treponema sp.]
MKNKFFAMFDYFLILVVLVLVTIGVLSIYSSSINSEGVSVTNEYIKQIIWASIGLVLMVFVTLYDYRRIENISMWLYIALILVLIYTRIFGRYVNGAKSWLGIGECGVQPSEFGKIFCTLFLAKYLDDSINEHPFKRFVVAALILMLPFGLILIQPDMGTASVYVPIFLVMCFLADIKISYLLYILLFGSMSIFFTILPVWNNEISRTSYTAITILTNYRLLSILIGSTGLIAVIGFIVRRYFHGPKYTVWITYFFSIITLSLFSSIFMGKVLKDYQIKRLIIFMDPNTDPLGAGWNIIQSKIAIGAGGILGKTYLHGTQSHYRFLPQQSTDFIFSIFSEEFGFIGGIIVFSLYLFIFIRILFIIKKCPNRYGVNIAAGIFGMFNYHFFINVGMVMGSMPITGIPLLFMSYGGSSLLTAMICIGLLMSINSRQKELK